MSDPPPPSRGRARGRARARPMGPGHVELAPTPESLPEIEVPMEHFQIQEPGGQAAVIPGSIKEEVDPEAKAKEVWKEFMMRRDYLKTRPDHVVSKVGTIGLPLQLVSNYFPVQLTGDLNWRLQQFRVDFNPEQDNTFIRKVLVRKLVDELPAYIFDGGSLFYSHGILPRNPLVLSSIFKHKDGTEQVYEVCFKKTREVAWNDVRDLLSL